jgi:hypothetical protein
VGATRGGASAVAREEIELITRQRQQKREQRERARRDAEDGTAEWL